MFSELALDSPEVQAVLNADITHNPIRLDEILEDLSRIEEHVESKERLHHDALLWCIQRVAFRLKRISLEAKTRYQADWKFLESLDFISVDQDEYALKHRFIGYIPVIREMICELKKELP